MTDRENERLAKLEEQFRALHERQKEDRADVHSRFALMGARFWQIGVAVAMLVVTQAVQWLTKGGQ